MPVVVKGTPSSVVNCPLNSTVHRSFGAWVLGNRVTDPMRASVWRGFDP